MKLTGYIRPDGRVGFRNYTVILPLVGCLSDIARRISSSDSNSVPLIHPNGCELVDFDADWMALQMERLVTHPNVRSVLFLTMGCASTNTYRLSQKAASKGKLVESINFHATGGTHKTVEKGVQLIQKMTKKSEKEKKEPVDVSSITLGTKCGSSDKSSFDFLHTVTGLACDRIVDEGGTVVLSEDFELYADIETLAERGINAEVKAGILSLRDDLQARFKRRFNKDLPWSEEMKEGSAKHAAKAGSRPIQRVVPLKEVIEGPGMIIYNGPNSDLVSVTAMAVAGCNMIVFTTGRGTPIGGPCLPAVKVTANRRTAQSMPENIDISFPGVVEGTQDFEEAADLLYDKMVRVANGEMTQSENLKHFEMQIHINGVTY